MKVNVVSLDNKKISDIELSENVFGCTLRKDILFRVVEWQRAKKQAGTHRTKEISDIIGTTKKPFNQKGTGNARQGNKKAPHMRGGVVSHGPRVRSHAYKLQKKVRVLGLKTALSLKLSEGKLLILENANLEDVKTKGLSEAISNLKFSSALFIDNGNDNLRKASGNLKGIDILPVGGANVYDILRHENLLLTVDAVKALEERLA